MYVHNIITEEEAKRANYAAGCMCCEHVKADPSLARHEEYEMDHTGIYDRDVSCEACYKAAHADDAE